MEIEWNFEKLEVTGTTTASRELSDISHELRSVVTRIFMNSHGYHDLDLVSRYQQVFETVSFIFEDYRKAFERIIKKRMETDLTQDQQQVEAIVFCSWVSIEVMTTLSNHYKNVAT